MNGYTFFILLAFSVEYFLNLTADILNLKVMTSDLPEEFKEVYDQANYRRSQNYNRILTIWGLFKSSLILSFILVFWFSGSFNSLDHLLRKLGYNSFLTGLFYFGSLAVLSSILTLPFIIFETFVIEEKFGFNRVSLSTFVLDLFKKWCLGILLGLPLLSGILYFFESFGSSAWWIAWMLISLVIFMIQWLGPSWIMPLFNRFIPLENGKLRESIMSYGMQVNFPIENIYVMDGSKRSSKGNAFFTGFGKRKRIALFDTLLERNTDSELVAILAHEIGHYKKKHILLGTILSTLNLGLLFFLLSHFINNSGLREAFYIDHSSIYSSLVLFFLSFSPIEFLLSILFLIYFRRNEFDADEFAVRSLASSDSLIQALKKLAMDNLANLNPHPFHVFLNDSHPPLMERIQAIRQHHFV